MRTFKILSISLIIAVIATFATKDIWQEPTDIYVTFNTKSTKDFKYQIFYTNESVNNFSRKQVVNKMVSAGEQNVEITLPTKNVFQFRIDFGFYPGTILISDLKLIGNKTIHILADNEANYFFNQVEEHQFIDGRALRIVSNQADPYMIYKKKLDITYGTIINWSKLLQIAFGTFFIVLFLGLFVTRKKSRKAGRKIS